MPVQPSAPAELAARHAAEDASEGIAKGVVEGIAKGVVVGVATDVPKSTAKSIPADTGEGSSKGSGKDAGGTSTENTVEGLAEGAVDGARESGEDRPAAERQESRFDMSKSGTAYRTISEVADLLDVPQHVLRFWETRFTQIKPMKRAGGRRYYRPEDVSLLEGIRHLLYGEGYTLRGVQRILREKGVREVKALGRRVGNLSTVYEIDEPAEPAIEGPGSEGLGSEGLESEGAAHDAQNDRSDRAAIGPSAASAGGTAAPRASDGGAHIGASVAGTSVVGAAAPGFAEAAAPAFDGEGSVPPRALCAASRARLKGALGALDRAEAALSRLVESN